MIYQIAYVSLSKTPLDEVLLSDILTSSIRNNIRDGISGVLMYHDRLFFQILEGERTLVKNYYRRILRDPRHSAISLMWEDEAETRVFSSSAMSYAGPDEISLQSDYQLVSLADLTSGENTTKGNDSIASLLAGQVFRIFSGVDRLGQSFSPLQRPKVRDASAIG